MHGEHVIFYLFFFLLHSQILACSGSTVSGKIQAGGEGYTLNEMDWEV